MLMMFILFACKLLLTPREAAQALGVSDRTLWSLTFERNRGLPFLKLGRLTRYPAEDLRRWIAEQQKKGGDAE